MRRTARIVSSLLVSAVLVVCSLKPLPAQAAAAQIVAVPAPAAGRSEASSTLTLLYSVDDPQVTVILLPGGEGYLRFNESTRGTKNQTALMLQNLTRAEFSKLRINVVILDSPYELYPLSQRRSADHLDRIERVVLYYREKFNTPIWLLGHSNGSISVTEFINRSTEASALIAGVITSGSRYEIEFKSGVNVPILFLHHERDGCKSTSFGQAQSNYEKTRLVNKQTTELAVVKGGEERGDPCRDGRHMYLGAYEEAARLVEQFVARNHPVSEKR